MIGDLFKYVGSMMFARAVLMELEDWWEFNRNPNPETMRKAIEVSDKAQFMGAVGLLFFVIGNALNSDRKG